MSNKYLSQPSHPGYVSVEARCDQCKVVFWESRGSFRGKVRHFCSQPCYTEYKKTIPKELHPRWQGGVSQTEAHRRWRAKNPERMAHLKALRYARERGAEGSHTLDQWQSLLKRHNNLCAHCHEPKPLTKDHIRPLSLGGTNHVWNIQPLCRNCNSRKWAKVENPELLPSPTKENDHPTN